MDWIGFRCSVQNKEGHNKRLIRGEGKPVNGGPKSNYHV